MSGIINKTKAQEELSKLETMKEGFIENDNLQKLIKIF